MATNFLACDHEQAFLMSPEPRDWLPEGPSCVVPVGNG